jgi:hypothetical protein
LECPPEQLEVVSIDEMKFKCKYEGSLQVFNTKRGSCLGVWFFLSVYLCFLLLLAHRTYSRRPIRSIIGQIPDFIAAKKKRNKSLSYKAKGVSKFPCNKKKQERERERDCTCQEKSVLAIGVN